MVRRNEQLEIAERQRVGKLVERVEKIKERAAEYGPKHCRSVTFHLKNYFQAKYVGILRLIDFLKIVGCVVKALVYLDHQK